MNSMLLLFFLVTTGSFISSLTGLGGGSLILAGLLMIYPPTLAIPLHSFTQLAANGLRSAIFYKQVRWRVVFFYALLMFPFAWMGALLFDHVNPSLLKIIVGSFILISLLPFKKSVAIEPDMRTFLGLGAVSGFLGVFVGAVGPLVTPFFNRLKIGREGSLSTKSAGQMFLQLSKILAFTGASGIDFMLFKENVGVLVLGTIVGVSLSIPIGKRISDKRFDQIINGLLILIAIKILFEGFRELFFSA